MIALFVRHPVAPNLLMALMLLTGVVALGGLNRQFFPTVESSIVGIQVIWPGAAAEDVANLITLPIQAELRTLDGLDGNINSTTTDGGTFLAVTFVEGTNVDLAVSEIKSRVDGLRNMPTGAEEPIISVNTAYDNVAWLLLTGPDDEHELRRVARDVERSLLDAGIDRVIVSGGTQVQEIAIQVGNGTLRELGLSLDAVSERVRDLSRDMPAGTLGRDDVTTQLRALEQRRRVVDFERIPVFSDELGQRLLLGDIATVERRPRPDQVDVLYEGRPAVVLELQRSAAGDMLESGAILRQWLRDTTLPQGVEMRVFNEGWTLVQEIIELLLENGLSGLVLVLIVLFLFLNRSVAFWVAAGIPVAITATLGALLMTGGSLNMFSLFALIMTLGIIVDDAIVVGEDIVAHREQGIDPQEAAERGARRMAVPVVSGSLTTIVAFIPLLIVGGFIGVLLYQVPLVAICAIAASLIEVFLILPGHLRHGIASTEQPGRVRAAVDAGLERFRDGVFHRTAQRAVDAPGIVLALGIALLLLAAGIVQGGHLRFHFFPQPEGSIIHANAAFVSGTSRLDVRDFMLELEQELHAVQDEVGEEFIDLSYVQLGQTSGGSPIAGVSGGRRGSTMASIIVELTDPEERDTRNVDIMHAWEQRVREAPGLESLVIAEPVAGPPGADLDTMLTGADPLALKAAAIEVAERLRVIPGAHSVEDNMPYGRRQLVFELTAEGEALGLTVSDVGRQLGAAYDGSLAQLFQDGDDEVEVRVMLPDDARNRIAGLEQFGIMAPSGETVPLESVVDLTSRQSFDSLRYSGDRLRVNITASVDRTVTTAGEVNRVLVEQVLPDLALRHHVEFSPQGRTRTQEQTLAELRTGFIVALVLVYLVLAWNFHSYLLPLAVMSAVPFGLVGVVAGHLLMGIDASVLSILGIFAMTGIVVNDSIILVGFYRELREGGMPGPQAIVEAARQRLRAVVLTSLTTIAGLAPLMFEGALQAQFLIPMAVGVAFGLAFSTVVVLLLVPALLAFCEQFMAPATAPGGAVAEP